MNLKIQKNKPLKEVCTLGIGGPATNFVEVRSIEEMQSALKTALEKDQRTFILGKGSNCLFHDLGFDGLVIHNKIDFLEKSDNGRYTAGAGFSFSRLGTITAREGWAGLEFASGIPGTVGGAVFMNAGANGTETCEALESIQFMDMKGNLKIYQKEELEFAYRTSSFHTMKGAIIAATFQLTPSAEAREKQIQIINTRTATQPYGDQTAGCIFRNPDQGHAGKLIDECGLKGLRIGGAEVSPIHANFFVNRENSRSEDLQTLISTVQQRVKEQTGIELESEVRVIPFREES